MTTLRFQLFGKISIQQDEQILVDLPIKALELLCYLLLYRERIHTRENLAELLWPDTPNSKKYFRQAFWQLQAVLERYLPARTTDGEALFLLNPGWIRVNPQAAWWLDVAGLEQAYGLCSAIPGAALTAQEVQAIEDAIALYQGDLLETWYQDWCVYERERLQLIYLDLLDKLVAYYTAQQLYTKGISYGQRILRCDPAREVTYQQLMRLYYLAGDRTTALREYARCERALKREFNLPPMQATVDLYEQIRTDRLVEKPMSTLLQPETRQGAPSPVELHQQLTQLQANLADFQAHVQQELTTIVHLLNQQAAAGQQCQSKTA